MRKIVIKDLDELPAVAHADFWCEQLGCHKLTLHRAEASGKLKRCGSPAHKLYSKAAILAFLNIDPEG